ncbi:hypothetical protein HYU14_02745 [Candidatus Woesearchaeota archaeon]|nr:hypothetical protein [Candidatus Woesearchaeota archaeon]
MRKIKYRRARLCELTEERLAELPWFESIRGRKIFPKEPSAQQVEQARALHLYPFLRQEGQPGRYEHLLMRLPERRFWDEISYLVHEHRPDSIASLVKRRYVREKSRLSGRVPEDYNPKSDYYDDLLEVIERENTPTKDFSDFDTDSWGDIEDKLAQIEAEINELKFSEEAQFRGKGFEMEERSAFSHSGREMRPIEDADFRIRNLQTERRQLLEKLYGDWDIGDALRASNLPEGHVPAYNPNDWHSGHKHSLPVERRNRHTQNIFAQRALDSLKNLAERHYNFGEWLEGQTVQAALTSLGRDYTLVGNDSGFRLMKYKIENGEVFLPRMHLKLPLVFKIIIRSLSDSFAGINISPDSIDSFILSGSGKRRKVPHPKFLEYMKYGSTLHIEGVHGSRKIAIAIAYDGSQPGTYTARLTNIGPEILGGHYLAHLDPFFTGASIVPEPYRGFKGEFSFSREQAGIFLEMLSKNGYRYESADNGRISFSDGSRVELVEGSDKGIPFYRARVFGNLPVFEIRQRAAKRLSFEETVDRALYDESLGTDNRIKEKSQSC